MPARENTSAHLADLRQFLITHYGGLDKAWRQMAFHAGGHVSCHQFQEVIYGQAKYCTRGDARWLFFVLARQGGGILRWEDFCSRLGCEELAIVDWRLQDEEDSMQEAVLDLNARLEGVADDRAEAITPSPQHEEAETDGHSLPNSEPTVEWFALTPSTAEQSARYAGVPAESEAKPRRDANLPWYDAMESFCKESHTQQENERQCLSLNDDSESRFAPACGSKDSPHFSGSAEWFALTPSTAEPTFSVDSGHNGGTDELTQPGSGSSSSSQATDLPCLVQSASAGSLVSFANVTFDLSATDCIRERSLEIISSGDHWVQLCFFHWTTLPATTESPRDTSPVVTPRSHWAALEDESPVLCVSSVHAVPDFMEAVSPLLAYLPRERSIAPEERSVADEEEALPSEPGRCSPLDLSEDTETCLDDEVSAAMEQRLCQEPSYVHREDCGLPVPAPDEHCCCQVSDPGASQALISRKPCNCGNDVDAWIRTIESRMDFMLSYADVDDISQPTPWPRPSPLPLPQREAVRQLYDSTDAWLMSKCSTVPRLVTTQELILKVATLDAFMTGVVTDADQRKHAATAVRAEAMVSAEIAAAEEEEPMCEKSGLVSLPQSPGLLPAEEPVCKKSCYRQPPAKNVAKSSWPLSSEWGLSNWWPAWPGLYVT